VTARRPQVPAAEPHGAGSDEAAQKHGDLASLLRPDPSRLALLRRCTIAGAFTVEVYDQVLRADGDPDLGSLVEDYSINTLNSEDLYRVPGGTAAGHWSDLATGSLHREYAELSTRLADYYAEHGPAIEQLRHLAGIDPQAAAALFKGLYADLERRGALTGCRELVDVFTEPGRAQLFSESLHDLRDLYDLRLAARSLRAADLQATREESARYLHRPRLEDRLKELFTLGEDAWLRLVVGGGAVGKTTLLRWLLAHGCPEPDPAPVMACARLDCAAYGEAAVLAAPWLLLVEAARQLDRQLARSPFRSFLQRYGRDGWRLRESADHAARLGDREPAANGNAVDRGRAAIAEFSSVLAGTRPALVVIDTLDRCFTMSRANPERLRDLVSMLDDVHRAAPSFKTVLACRYDVNELVPDFDAVAGAEPIRVGLFDQAEAEEFLTLRDVRDEALREAIVERSNGEPMVLDLFTASEVAGLTARQVRTMTEPVFNLLATRFLGHDPDPVIRCVLWLSCLSPRLRVDEFLHVYLPALADKAIAAQWRALAGSLDRKFRPSDTADYDQPWQVPVPEAAAALWIRIVERARNMRWMDADDEGISVNPQVVRHLREELRGSTLYRDMHHRLAAHAEELLLVGVPTTEAEQEAWPRRQRDAIYHGAAASDTDAAPRWQRAVDDARARGRLDWARAVTEGMLADFDPDVDTDRHLSLLSHRDRYIAHVELAILIAQQGCLLPGPRGAVPPGWRAECAEALSIARALPGAAGTDFDAIVDAGDQNAATARARQYAALLPLALTVEAAQARVAAPVPPEDAGSAAESVRAVLDGELNPDGYCSEARRDAFLVLARANRVASGIRDGAEPRWQQSYRSAYDTALDCGGAAWVALEAARVQLADERLNEAAQWCDLAIDSPLPDPADGGRSAAEAPGLWARVLLAAGRPAAALEALGRADPDVRVLADYHTEAACRLALRQPATAVAVLVATPPRIIDTASYADRLDTLLLQARARGLLLDLPAVESVFAQARSLVAEAGPVLGAAVAAAHARHALSVIGDLARARYHLGADPGGARVGDPVWIELESCRAEIAVRQHDFGEAARVLRGLAAVGFDHAAPRRSRMAALEALFTVAALPVQGKTLCSLPQGTAAGIPAPDEILEAWLDQIELAPEDDRAGMLGGLSRCPDFGSLTRLRHRVASLLPPVRAAAHPGEPARREAARQDAAVRDVQTAELYRLVRDRRTALQLRDQAAEVLCEDEPYLRWEFLAAEDHVRLPEPDRPEIEPFRRHYGQWDLLYGSFLVELVNVYGHDGKYHAARRWLSEAESLLAGATRRPTVRHLRCWEALERAAHARGERDSQQHAAEQVARLRSALGLGPEQAQAPPAEAADRAGSRTDMRRAAAVRSQTPPASASAVSTSGSRRAGGEREQVLTISQSGADTVFSVTTGGDEPRGERGTNRPVRIPDVTLPETVSSAAELAASAQQVGRVAAAGLAELAGWPADVRLSLASAQIGSLPWELLDVGGTPLSLHEGVHSVVRHPGPWRRDWYRTRCVQGALSAIRFEPGPRDGVAGSMTDSALRRFQDSARVPGADGPLSASTLSALVRALEAEHTTRRLRVHVLQPAIGGTLDLLRRSQQHADRVEDAYRTAFTPAGHGQPYGLDVQTVAGGDRIAALGAGPPGRHEPVHVLHVCTVMEPTAHMPVMGFGSASGMPVTAEEMDVLVRALTGNAPPLVVVDVLPPPSQGDIYRQLVLRNRFAHQLLGLGNVDTVIATGFEGGPPAERVQARRIAEGLAQGLTAGDICRSIQRHRPPDGQTGESELAAYQSTALFSGLPAGFPISPGLIR
jgi:cellulose synthase operon protein C